MSTPISIHGSRFKGTGFAGPSAVHIGPTNGATNVSDVVVVSDKLITCKIPDRDPSWPARVGLWVTTPYGTGVRERAFRYNPPASFEVLSISPTSGHHAGGTSVVIAGHKFTDATEVVWDLFGDETPATSFVIDSDLQITAVSPGGTQYAPYGIKVRLSTGEEFAYKCNDPLNFAWGYSGDPVCEVDSLEPNHGSWLGGYTVTVKGRGFLTIGLTSVEYGALVGVSGGVIVDNETFTFDMEDPSVAGWGPYSGTPLEIWFSQTGYAHFGMLGFEQEKLTIESIEPAQVSRDGGETVTMRGKSLDTITEIHVIDDGLVTDVDVFASITVISGEEITFVMPVIDPASDSTLRITIVGADPGTGFVEGGGDPSYASDEWRWKTTIDVLPGSRPPAPIAILPTTGSAAGGDHVVIEVADSTGLTSASIDGTNLTGFAIDDGTHVSGDTVAHAAWPAGSDVRVADASGPSARLIHGYVYA